MVDFFALVTSLLLPPALLSRQKWADVFLANFSEMADLSASIFVNEITKFQEADPLTSHQPEEKI